MAIRDDQDLESMLSEIAQKPIDRRKFLNISKKAAFYGGLTSLIGFPALIPKNSPLGDINGLWPYWCGPVGGFEAKAAKGGLSYTINGNAFTEDNTSGVSVRTPTTRLPYEILTQVTAGQQLTYQATAVTGPIAGKGATLNDVSFKLDFLDMYTQLTTTLVPETVMTNFSFTPTNPGTYKVYAYIKDPSNNVKNWLTLQHAVRTGPVVMPTWKYFATDHYNHFPEGGGEFNSMTEVEQAFFALFNMKFSAVRFDMPWHKLNSALGVYDFNSNWDSIMNLPNAWGKKIVAGLGKTPAWASSGNTGNPILDEFYVPANMKDAADFAYTLLNRYPNRIAAYHPRNEPNDPSSFSGSQTDMAELQKYMFLGAKLADPRVVALSPTITSPDNDTGQIANVWLQNYYGAGNIGPYMDAVAINLYRNPNGYVPGATNGMLSMFRDIIDENDIPNKPIWVTETGWAAPWNGYTEQQVADWIPVHLGAMANFGNKIGWYNFMDKSDSFSIQEDNYGLIRSAHSATPYQRKKQADAWATILGGVLSTPTPTVTNTPTNTSTPTPTYTPTRTPTPTPTP